MLASLADIPVLHARGLVGHHVPVRAIIGAHAVHTAGCALAGAHLHTTETFAMSFTQRARVRVGCSGARIFGCSYEDTSGIEVARVYFMLLVFFGALIFTNMALAVIIQARPTQRQLNPNPPK